MKRKTKLIVTESQANYAKHNLLKENDDLYMHQKLKQLVESGDGENIEIAMQICQGLGIDFFEEILPDYKGLVYYFEQNRIYELNGAIDYYSANLVAHFLNKTTLNLEDKDITSLPLEIRVMKNLKYLYLSYNRGLRELPAFLGNMGLFHLDIVGTTISTIPDTFINNPINKDLQITYSYELDMPEEKIKALDNNIRFLKETDI
jgi:hypothetical protein